MEKQEIVFHQNRYFNLDSFEVKAECPIDSDEIVQRSQR